MITALAALVAASVALLVGRVIYVKLSDAMLRADLRALRWLRRTGTPPPGADPDCLARLADRGWIAPHCANSAFHEMTARGEAALRAEDALAARGEPL